MINSDEKKQTCHSKGCPKVISINSIPTLRQLRRVFSLANDHKGAECHPRVDCPTHLSPVVAIRKWCARLRGKSKFPLHVPCVFNLREIWGYCWPGQLLYTTKSTLRRSSCMRTCAVLLKKGQHRPIEEMTVARG